MTAASAIWRAFHWLACCLTLCVFVFAFHGCADADVDFARGKAAEPQRPPSEAARSEKIPQELLPEDIAEIDVLFTRLFEILRDGGQMILH